MAKTYNTCINEAFIMKQNLTAAINNDDQKNIIYYRGKYLNLLKQIYKMNPSAVISSLSSKPIEDEIKDQLDEHQATINIQIKENKKSASVKKNTLSKEIGLKIRNLATSITKLKMANTDQEKKAARKEVAKNSLKLSGTALKTPVMATAKVLTLVGPIAILITTLPLMLFASSVSFFWSLSNDKEPQFKEYSNTPIHQMSFGLQSAVKSLSGEIYNTIGRL